eukprot:GHVT01066337.1.p1 GENE.GHVT01066337.1~~GHVT01066337.1.p1  ORF type:complete len:564 (-),score=36.61 GHVT01066337.1:449-2044(-)
MALATNLLGLRAGKEWAHLLVALAIVCGALCFTLPLASGNFVAPQNFAMSPSPALPDGPRHHASHRRLGLGFWDKLTNKQDTQSTWYVSGKDQNEVSTGVRPKANPVNQQKLTDISNRVYFCPGLEDPSPHVLANANPVNQRETIASGVQDSSAHSTYDYASQPDSGSGRQFSLDEPSCSEDLVYDEVEVTAGVGKVTNADTSYKYLSQADLNSGGLYPFCRIGGSEEPHCHEVGGVTAGVGEVTHEDRDYAYPNQTDLGLGRPYSLAEPSCLEEPHYDTVAKELVVDEGNRNSKYVTSTSKAEVKEELASLEVYGFPYGVRKCKVLGLIEVYPKTDAAIRTSFFFDDSIWEAGKNIELITALLQNRKANFDGESFENIAQLVFDMNTKTVAGFRRLETTPNEIDKSWMVVMDIESALKPDSVVKVNLDNFPKNEKIREAGKSTHHEKFFTVVEFWENIKEIYSDLEELRIRVLPDCLHLTNGGATMCYKGPFVGNIRQALSVAINNKEDRNVISRKCTAVSKMLVCSSSW